MGQGTDMTEPTGNPTGRPQVVTAEVEEEIIRRMLEGETLRAICRDEHMPSRSTIFLHLARSVRDGTGFSDQYTRAMQFRAFHFAEDTLAIADDTEEDWETRTNEEGENYVAVNRDHIARAKLRVETRKWYMERLAPRHYGKPTQTITAEPTRIIIQKVDFSALQPEPIIPKRIPGRSYRPEDIDTDADDF